MKYLQKSFSVSMYNPQYRDRFMRDWADTMSGRQEERLKKASKPHEYINGGAMCQLCGLDSRAPIHLEEQ